MLLDLIILLVGWVNDDLWRLCVIVWSHKMIGRVDHVRLRRLHVVFGFICLLMLYIWDYVFRKNNTNT